MFIEGHRDAGVSPYTNFTAVLDGSLNPFIGQLLHPARRWNYESAECRGQKVQRHHANRRERNKRVWLRTRLAGRLAPRSRELIGPRDGPLWECSFPVRQLCGLLMSRWRGLAAGSPRRCPITAEVRS